MPSGTCIVLDVSEPNPLPLTPACPFDIPIHLPAAGSDYTPRAETEDRVTFAAIPPGEK
jgi:hypothetical protein